MTADDLVKQNENPQNSPDTPYRDTVRTRTFPTTQTTYYTKTPDAGLLHQYIALKDTLANNVWGLGNTYSHPSILSIIAHQGRQCVGGAQIALSFPRENHTLPCEQQGFSLQRSLPELDLYNVIYGEIADFAAYPQYQDGKEIIELFRTVIVSAMETGVQYLFVSAPLTQAKRFRNAAHIFSLQCTVLQHIELPEYDELAGGRACLTVLDLTGMEYVADV